MCSLNKRETKENDDASGFYGAAVDRFNLTVDSKGERERDVTIVRSFYSNDNAQPRRTFTCKSVPGYTIFCYVNVKCSDMSDKIVITSVHDG